MMDIVKLRKILEILQGWLEGAGKNEKKQHVNTDSLEISFFADGDIRFVTFEPHCQSPFLIFIEVLSVRY